MSLLPYSGFEVLAGPADQLTIAAHPEWGPAYLGIAAFLLAVFLFFRARSLPTDSGSRLFAPVLLFAAAVISWAAVAHGQAVLDRATNTVTVHRVTSFFLVKNLEVPLSNLQHAEVRSSGSTEQFCLVLRDGNCVALKGYVNDSGQHQAAAAVNNFLGVR